MPTKEETRVVVIAQFTAKPDKEDELVARLAELLGPTHQEPGCLRYELNQCVENPRLVTYIEKFADQKAFNDHISHSYISDFFKNVAPALVESQNISFHREILP